MTGIRRYRRGDGVEFVAEEGSASQSLMQRSGEFTELVEVDGELVEAEIAAGPAPGGAANEAKSEKPQSTPAPRRRARKAAK